MLCEQHPTSGDMDVVQEAFASDYQGTIFFIYQFLPRKLFFFPLLSGAGAFMGMVWLALTNISHLEKNILINLPAESF